MEKFSSFSIDWIEAWNEHSIEKIMSHYDSDVEVRSPFLAIAVPGSEGLVSGKEKIQEIYSKSFIKYPELKFEIIHTFYSTESVVIYYRTVENMLAAETFWFNEKGLAKKVFCHYLVVND